MLLDGAAGGGDAPVLLLKSDTQGYEMGVLQGAARLLRTRPVGLLLVEASDFLLRRAGASPLRLMRLLDGLGFACTHMAFWAKLRDEDGVVKFKPLNRTHLPEVLSGRHSIPFEEAAGWLRRLPPLNSSGWTDLLCW